MPIPVFEDRFTDDFIGSEWTQVTAAGGSLLEVSGKLTATASSTADAAAVVSGSYGRGTKFTARGFVHTLPDGSRATLLALGSVQISAGQSSTIDASTFVAVELKANPSQAFVLTLRSAQAGEYWDGTQWTTTESSFSPASLDTTYVVNVSVDATGLATVEVLDSALNVITSAQVDVSAASLYYVWTGIPDIDVNSGEVSVEYFAAIFTSKNFTDYNSFGEFDTPDVVAPSDFSFTVDKTMPKYWAATAKDTANFISGYDKTWGYLHAPSFDEVQFISFADLDYLPPHLRAGIQPIGYYERVPTDAKLSGSVYTIHIVKKPRRHRIATKRSLETL